jgi:hypothetical protein
MDEKACRKGQYKCLLFCYTLDCLGIIEECNNLYEEKDFPDCYLDGLKNKHGWVPGMIAVWLS